MSILEGIKATIARRIPNNQLKDQWLPVEETPTVIGWRKILAETDNHQLLVRMKVDERREKPATLSLCGQTVEINYKDALSKDGERYRLVERRDFNRIILPSSDR